MSKHVQGHESLSLFGRMPLLLKEREYGTLGAHGNCFAYAIATWAFLTGGYAAQYVGAVQGVVCLVAGNIIGVLMMALPLSLACHRYGLEQIDSCKPAFGQYGARVILVFYLFNLIGWSGLILVMFGNGIENIVLALGFHPPAWLVGAGVAAGIIMTYVVVTHGVHLLKIFNAVVTPILAVLIIYMFYLLMSHYSWEEIASAPPLEPLDDPLLNYAIALELGVASGISWWGGIGFLARNTRTRRNAIFPELLQMGLSFGLVCSIALFSALVIGSDDPTQWMVPLGGVVLGVLALAFVALANITSTAVSVFASGLALRHIHALHTLPWRGIVVITIIPLCFFVVWPQQLYDWGDAFLAYNGTLQAPVGGIVMVDYFLLRRQRLELRAIFDSAPSGTYYYWKGFNRLALACVLLGQVAYFSMYNPSTGSAHWLFHWIPASIAAFVLPGVVYWIGMHRHFAGTLAKARTEFGEPRIVTPNI